MTTAPEPGKTVSIRVDALLSDDLKVLMRTRHDASDTTFTASDAVRRAVELTAEIYRNAWAMGLYPEGVEPHIQHATLAPHQPRPTPDPSV